MSYFNSDLCACMSRQPRPSAPVEDTSYKTEDLSKYLTTPVKPVRETVEPTQEEVVVTEAAEVSVTTTTNDQVSDLVETIIDSSYGYTPYSNNAVNKLQWRQWVMQTKALSKEYKLLLFESWISQLE